jgi:hypothetical protein
VREVALLWVAPLPSVAASATAASEASAYVSAATTAKPKGYVFTVHDNGSCIVTDLNGSSMYLLDNDDWWQHLQAVASAGGAAGARAPAAVSRTTMHAVSLSVEQGVSAEHGAGSGGGVGLVCVRHSMVGMHVFSLQSMQDVYELDADRLSPAPYLPGLFSAAITPTHCLALR